MATRRLITSGSPYEARYGYSRAVVDGDACWVSGTTDAGPDGTSTHPGDAVAQARASWAIIERALADAGFALADIVRTRMYVTAIDDALPVASVQGELLGDVRPASTLVQVAGLIHPSLLVEIEAEAKRRSGA